MGVVSDYKRVNGLFGRYEFESGQLVKIDGHRPMYMGGHRLIAELERAALLAHHQAKVIDQLKAELSKVRSGGTL